MPGMGATDPADLLAQARREAGLTRQLQQQRREPPHPSRGGCTGYDEWYRDDQLLRHQNGEEIDVSAASISRWQRRRNRYRRTGNQDRTQLVGVDMINMATFIIAHPDATLDEIAVFIYNEGGELYDNSTISRRLKELQITKKRASTEAYQAFTPENRFKAHVFFHDPPPLGIAGVPRRKLIDVDEFGLTLEKCNRSGGWALKCFRVRKEGHYKVGNKLTCLLAIEPGDHRLPPHQLGSVENPRRWVRCIQNGGTTVLVFRDFVDHICGSIEANPIPGTDDHRVFLWDNLISHHATYVNQTVTGRTGPCRFSIVPRPPYQPKYGPIEYKICDLTHEVAMRKQHDWDVARLEQEVYRAARRIGPFDSTFGHCGYTTI